MRHTNPVFGGYHLRENGLWLSDTVVGDASTARHGFLPKLPGDATKVLAGDGTFRSLTGAGAAVPEWVSGHPDTPPPNANAEDDEFESATLAGKWTQTLANSATADVHTTQKSHYWAKFTASNQNAQLTQPAPTGTGAFSLTAKMFMGLTPGGSTPAVYIKALDTVGNNGMYTKLYLSGTAWLASQLRNSGGGFTDLGVLTLGAPRTHIYLHLQRKAGNVWESWISLDGRAWLKLVSTTFSFTVNTIGMGLDAGNSLTANGMCGVDWFRRDWLTL